MVSFGVAREFTGEPWLSMANFYMAGQWVTPGGGLPPCLYSGRHGVQIVCHRDGKPFSTSVP